MGEVKRALIYARESKFQAKAGNRSTAEQIDESAAFCDRQGYQVIEVDGRPAIVDEDTGASRHSRGHRQGWLRTIGLVESGNVDVLVTWSCSRAQRDLAVYVELRDLCAANGVLWAYDGRVYDMADGDDRFRTAIDAAVAEKDSDEIRENVKRGLRANIANGKPHGPTLYGYRRVYDGKTGAFERQEVDPDQAKVVRDVFRRFLAGYSPRTIAAQLNDEGVPTSSGQGKWVTGTVSTMLRNAAYHGRRLHLGQDVGKACWPPLVDDATWSDVKKRLEARTKRWDSASPTKLLLSGIVRCGGCMQRMTRQPPTGSRGLGYVCRESHVFRNTERLDGYMTERLLRRLADVDIDGPSEDPAVHRARERAAKLRADLDEAMDLWKRGDLSVSAYTDMERHLLPQIADAEQVARRSVVPLNLDLPAQDRLAGWWVDELTAEQRREVMAAFVVAVVVRPVGRGNRSYRDEDFTTIEWRR